MNLSNAQKVCFDGKEVRTVVDTKTGKILYRKKQKSEILCFTAENGNGTVALNLVVLDKTLKLECKFKISYDTKNWQNYEIGTPINLANRQHVYFSAIDSNETLALNDGIYHNFVFSGDCKIAVSGKTTYLLDSTGQRTDVPECCFMYLFRNCVQLIQAPELPATQLDESCYNGMFNRCSSLLIAPELPATMMATACYAGMFSGCTSLVAAPTLPATQLAESCYNGMFRECSSLLIAPELPATTLATACYLSMFSGCTSLVAAPTLPATQLAESCYNGMFRECSSLLIAPELPATHLELRCYSWMFAYCSSLANAPTLPAEHLEGRCYEYMFYDCTSLSSITVNFVDWNDQYQYSTFNWLENVNQQGVFTCPKTLQTQRGKDAIPTNWTINKI